MNSSSTTNHQQQLWANSLLTLAEASVGIFFPFFLHEYFGLSWPMVFACLGGYWLLSLPMLAISWRWLERWNLKITLLSGVGLITVSFGLLLVNWSGAVWLMLVLRSLGVLLYFVAFHWWMVLRSQQQKRSVHLGNLAAWQCAVTLIPPVLGAIAWHGNWEQLTIYLALGSMILMASIISTIDCPQLNVPKFKKSNFPRKKLGVFVAEGCEDLSIGLLWPVGVWYALGNYLALGVFWGLSKGLEIITSQWVGRSKEYSLVVACSARSLDLLQRLLWFIFPSPATLGLIGLGAGAFGPFFGVPWSRELYKFFEQKADPLHQIVFREVGLALGRSGFVFLVAIGLWLSQDHWWIVFSAAGLVGLSAIWWLRKIH